MCGVPAHALESYLTKLVEKGYKVAIAEQMESPKQTKTLVRRDVVRVVTPGTIIDSSALNSGKNNYIISVYQCKSGFGLAAADVTTGVFTAVAFNTDDHKQVLDEIARIVPREIIINEGFENIRDVTRVTMIRPQVYALSAFHTSNAFQKLTEHFHTLDLKGFGIEQNDLEVNAAGSLLIYLSETQKNSLSHIVSIKKYSTDKFLTLDFASRRNLELTDTIRGGNKKHTLLFVLDNTKTPLGARTLRQWITQPLRDAKEINRRLDAVETFVNNPFAREELRECLNTVHDMERVMSKIIYNTANGRDLFSLKASVKNLPKLKKLLAEFSSELINEIETFFDPLIDIFEMIDAAIIDEPPVSLKDGGFIKDGYDKNLDNLREAKSDGAKWLKDLEEKERVTTGIRKLKVVYSRVFGYAIEISNANNLPIPERYNRRQTLANCERYITDELKRIEDAIIGADEKITALEYELFCELRDRIASEVTRIQLTASMIAALDALQALGDKADKGGYVKPIVDEYDQIEIKNGRHPVVETVLNSFVPNDTLLDGADNAVSIITGPNMAGKSTYMRQIALIVLMAQAGSFVPAEHARIGVSDRIFTRVGASDDLASGQSTFMAEMSEVANILNNATGKSLLLLDEIGRGTSTYDGLSIAWAVLEYIAQNIGAKTLFATHYHELTELEGKLPGVKNYRAAIQERGEEIIFLRKIVPGGADNSYGIQVARLAGLPRGLLDRARVIMDELNNVDIAKKAETRAIVSRGAGNRGKKVFENQLELEI
jgi:DNA mismatch repair protein MutS